MAGLVRHDDVEPLLEYLRQTRGFDFTSYKRPSLGRRIARRMQDVDVESYDRYVDYLEVHPEEFEALFNTILINVTGFFRDPSTWQYVADEVIPQILSRKTGDESVRVWSTACSSGEEAYTLAIILCEAMGVDAFQRRVKIYATDVDEPALAEARRAVYGEAKMAAVRADLLEKYFEPADGGSAFRPDLRRAVIFGRHDLVQDAPISRIDLLSCRNALMYLNAETQNRVLARFQYALERNGYLLLGKAETLLSRQQYFQPHDLKRRVFTKVGPGSHGDGPAGGAITFTDVSDHLRLEEELHTAKRELETAYEELRSTNEELTSANAELQTMHDDLRERTLELNRLNALMEAIFASVGRAIAVISRDLTVTVWNGQAEELWGLRRDEVEGSNLLTLDFGLPLDSVRRQIRACVEGDQTDAIVVDAVNRKGRHIRCSVHCTPIERAGAVEAAVLTMDVVSSP